MVRIKNIDKAFSRVLLKSSIRLVIAGYMFDGGSVFDIPDVLQEMRMDYKREIRKHKKNT